MATVNLNKNFLSGNGQVGIEVIPPSTQADVIAAFANNTPLPFRQINLGSISAKASAGTGEIGFGAGAGQVSFSGSASALAGLGAYPDPAQLLSDLKLDADLETALELPKDANNLYVALRWGYDLAASVKGAIALGAPLTFSASGKKEALYAVIRRLPKNTGAVTAITETAQSWMMPRQVTKLDDLEPGTWLIAEVDGSIAGSLGIKYGYDFNWVHEAQLMGLSGDIGLSLKLGVDAALGFNIASSFGLVVGRESLDANEKLLRFRLFRLRRNGLTAEFHAGASVQGDVSKFLPEYDEFIKAIFGVHGGQVLKDLELVKTWTNPQVSLGELLSGQGIKFGEDFLKKVTGIDPATAFNEARDFVVGFLDKWNNLPHQVSSTIWKFVEKKVDLTTIRHLAGEISTANADTFNNLIKGFIGDVEFLNTPAGEWLEKAAAKGLNEILNSSREFAKLQEIAAQTVAVLDGSKLESLLNELQDYVEKHLNLNSLFPGFGKLTDIIGAGSLADLDQASFAKLETWLKARLAAFIDKKIADLNLGDINKIRKTIFLFLNKAETFYAKTIEALNQKYEFKLSATYQSTTTNTALLDMTLDFNQAGVIGSLREALDGKYDDLLVNQRAGVKLNAGKLSHQIQRHSNVEINLPWMKKSIDHINESLANVEPVDTDSGRLLVYELKAKDIVEEKNKRQSRLAIGGFFKVPVNKVRIHSVAEITYSYTFRQVKKQMTTAAMQYQVRPYANTYLKKVFAQSPGGSDQWVFDLDRRIDELDDNGKKIFGDTLLGLNLSLPAAVGAGWLKAPPKAEQGPKVPVYLEMSRRLQAKLKEIIPLYYFANLDHFASDRLASKTLLVYSAIPPLNQIRVDGNVLTPTTDDYYWDIVQQTVRGKVVFLPQTRTNLEVILDRVNNLLVAAGMNDAAADFARDQADAIQRAVVQADQPNSGNLRSLLLAESEIVKGAREAGYQIAKFTQVNDAKPSEAVKALAKFGSNLADTFNSKIKSIYGDGGLRPLGTAMFIEASATLDQSAASAAGDATAVLDVTVLKRNSAFVMSSFLEGKAPDMKDILVHEKIIN
jgi:hypothetical protein